ncbi:MAG: hypothetical protein OHK93_002842 [Ramalina farinacea]|uniref:Guanine nucleotide-exchange factor SEC12 n=1 Tax=Ramalina farinacea TaxID=258253 RepID=A0AA43QVG2_9LECA|nr:hypothetical protein [Ramalina farinacea]
MSLDYATAKKTLSCPLYAADFDPQNNGFLLVGGGGGEGRSGVGNKITLLHAFKKQELSEVIEIDLSRDEDSVTSLAYAQSTDLWATAFAGINSSTKEQKEGNNQHLRSFLLDYPPKRKTGAGEGDAAQGEKPPEYAGKPKALGRVSYFTPTTTAKPETFQRVLRLSKKRKDNGPRMGAVATGLAPEGEIVMFAADTNSPSSNDIRGRINLGEKEEAADLDLAPIVEDDDASNFLFAYCTDYDVYTATRNFNYNRSEKCETQCIHSNPHPDVFAGSKARPKFRSLRFLTPFLLILQNFPNGKGAELLLMQTSGTILLRKRLHKKIKSGTALTVCSLPFTTPAPKSEPRVQHAIAVAGADTSITIITLDTPPSAPYPPAGKDLKFKQQELIKNSHPTSITSLAFSCHIPPTTPWVSTPAQYLKLASTSIANTVVVHTFPLFPYPPPPKTPHEDTKPASGYLLAPPPHRRETATETLFSLMMACLAIALSAFALQAFSEIRGVSPEVLGAKGWLSGSWHDALVSPNIYGSASPQEVFDNFVSRGGMRKAPVMAASSVSTVLQGSGSSVSSAAAGEASGGLKGGLRELVRSRDRGNDTADEGNDGNAIVVHHTSFDEKEDNNNNDSPTPSKGELSAALHPEELIQQRHKGARKWEDLASHEKEVWKRRLEEAGQWAVEEGETVLKGVFFSGLAGAVGAAVHAEL